MKINMTILALTAPAAAAFLASTAFTRATQQSTSLFSSVTLKPDTTSAIEEALEATKKFGATSAEARVAWDVVYDMEGAGDTEVHSNHNSLSDDEMAQAQRDFEVRLAEAKELMKEQGPKMQELQSLVNDNKAVKLSVAEIKSMPKTPEVQAALKEAIANARTAEIKFGSNSPEARVAWVEVEDVASAGRAENALGGRIEPDDCLIESESSATCLAFTELKRLVEAQPYEEEGDSLEWV